MAGIQLPHSSKHPISIDHATVSSLEGKSIQTNLYGGFTEDGTKAWLVRGPILEVVSTVDGERVSAHHFDVTTEDPTIHITSVKEFVFRGVTAFLLGLKSDSRKGLVCVYVVATGKVVMAVSMPYGVTSVDAVTSEGGINAPNFCLSQQMQKFFGIAAVGTEKGHLYLLDLRVDENDTSNERSVREAKIVTLETQYIENLRLRASHRGEHLCLEINSNSHSYFAFHYLRPDEEILRDYSPDDIFISNVTYLPHSGTLAVGFSFGCFQLWQLAEPTIEYSSPISPQYTPVSCFASQEPTDDPQYFCYLWVGRGPLPWDSRQDVPTDIHLFQLAYDEKTYHGTYGHLFKELNNCIPRFLHNLTHDPYLCDEDLSLGSRLIGCYTLEKSLSQEGQKDEDSMDNDDDDAEYKASDRTLTLLVWEGRPETPDGQLESNYFLAIFDLNQWYYAQMPAKIKMSHVDRNVCKYFSFYSLESIQEMCAPDFLLSVHVNPTGISRYQSTTPSMLELHQQPTSLSFKATCLMETAVVKTDILGIQKKVLADINAQGPVVLREPSGIYTRCLESQLILRSTSDEGLGRMSLVEKQREAILTVALENDQISFILQCIYNWSQGDFSSGIGLRALMEWTWQQVVSKKQLVDDMCEPLFNGEGTYVDEQMMKKLSQCSKQQDHLVVIFKALLDQDQTTTEQGVQDLSTKLLVLSLLAEHLRTLLWFVRSGLLPECTGPARQDQFCYPASLLHHAYLQRRAQLKKLSGLDSSLLLIDGIVEEAGSDLTDLWRRSDERSDGLYPPPSLHALLDMYLLEKVPLFTKQCIVGYMLLDIESTLGDSGDQQLTEYIRKFDSSLSVPLGLTKLVQAFWLLDHRDFAEALNMLLDPMTDTNLSSWQHGAIIRAFLYHGEGQKALQYVRAVRPPLTTPDDIKLHLTVLLANGLTGEAFNFQRDYHDETTSEELLYHLFLGSQQTKTMDQLLKLPYQEREEVTLRKYLLESTEPNSQEILVMHQLQRAQFVEATRLNKKVNQQMMMMETDTASRERTIARNTILEKCQEVMPAVQRKLAFSPEVSMSRSRGRQHEVPRPKPLSTKINPAKTRQVISHALLMTEVLEKIAEARESLKEEEETPTKSLLSPAAEIEPFVGTPITPSSKTRKRYSTAFVYPEQSDLTSSMWHPSTAPSHLLNQQSRLFSRTETPQSLKVPKRTRVDYTGADAMSLLQTPQFKKKTSRTTQKEQPPSALPQSILRVRQVMRRSPSPSSQGSPESPLPPPLPSFSSIDLTLPTPPAFHRTLSAKETDGQKVSMPPTPQKHLRFTEDTRGATPSPDVIQMGESSSEPSPEEGSSPQRGPSPEFMTPPSGSPAPVEQIQDEPKLTFEERLSDLKENSQEEKAAQEHQVRFDEEEVEMESQAPVTDSESSDKKRQSLLEENRDPMVELELEKDEEMGEEEFHDVENTEDLMVSSSGPQVMRDVEEIVETIDESEMEKEPFPNTGDLAVPFSDPVGTRENDRKVESDEIRDSSPLKMQDEINSEEEEEEDNELEEEKEVKMSDDDIKLPSKEVAPPLAGSGERDDLLESASEVEIQDDVVKGIREDDEKMEEGDDEDSEITFNFHAREDASKIGAVDEEDKVYAANLKEQKTEGIPGVIAPLLPRESGDTQYDKDTLSRPPIHPLPHNIEERWGSPTRSTTTHLSPDRLFHLGEPHPFPTPPQRTDTDEEAMEEGAVGGPPLPPAPTRATQLTQENAGIQTSPFVTELPPHAMATASSQTTPGLGITTQVQTSQKRAPFNMSLRSQSKMQSPAPMPAQVLAPMPAQPVKADKVDLVPEEETSNKDASNEKVSATPLKEPPSLMRQTAQKETPKGRTPSKPPPSFIFSPPSTRSKSRRQTMSSISREMPRDEASDSILSQVTLAGDISLISATSSPGKPKSVKHPVRRSRRSSTPTASPAVVDVTEDIPQKESATPVVTRRLTRSRRGKTLPEQGPSDSPVNLISPVVEEGENETKPKRGSQKVVRIPRHSMSLRTSSRKNRSMKLF